MRPLFLIERDRELRELFTDVLTESGYPVDAFESAEVTWTALAAPGAELPRAVLADETTTGEFEAFCSRLRQSQRTAAIPLVLLSTRPAAVHAVPRLGLAGFLVKPFDLQQLIDLASKLSADPSPPNGTSLPAEQLAVRLRAFYDCPAETAGAIAGHVRAAASWPSAIAPGIFLKPLAEELPPKQARETFLLRVQHGQTFPFHPHPRRERLLCLQGGLRDSDGSVLWAGEAVTHLPGSAHANTAIGEQDCIVAVLLDD